MDGTAGDPAAPAIGKPFQDEEGDREGEELGRGKAEGSCEGEGMVAASAATSQLPSGAGWPGACLLSSALAQMWVQSQEDLFRLAVVLLGEGSKHSLPLQRPAAVTQQAQNPAVAILAMVPWALLGSGFGCPPSYHSYGS